MPLEGSAVPLLEGEEQWGSLSTSLIRGGAAAGGGAGAAYAGEKGA